ncbi:hypothetical protein DFQ04_1414 [Algoriphagus boseongensis]|uniref:Methyltransferase family protein n=1 Tax=Algoriphagus boseongensis TaxID=1442587 RepID=A0A4R6T9V8_9BACT|nr:hypothetical protein [Algoriphagus boseongensis]TDQ19591.1 hypothetical protein DFQ04_1414 [Algoriphagus boseongensis]
MPKKNSILHSLRLWLYVKRLNYFQKKLKNDIQKFTSSQEGGKYKQEGNFISQNGLKIFPYPFQFQYIKDAIELGYEEGYPFFNYKGSNLYLPNSMSAEKAKGYANEVLMEQDERSPHVYQTPLFSLDQEDILLDIGCGDANFSLESIEKVKKVFLFEADPKWVVPIQKTFKNWKEKVLFFNKRVGVDADSIDLVTLEELESQNLFFKIDVDGAEREVLKLIDPLFPKLGSIKVAICTYHQNADADEFEAWFKSRGFETSFGKGYMLFHPDRKIKKPFFRPGVLFAYRNAG